MNGDREERARDVAEMAWQQWTRRTNVIDGAENTEIIHAIAAAVDESYVEGMDDDEWLQATMERLELERGGTDT